MQEIGFICFALFVIKLILAIDFSAWLTLDWHISRKVTLDICNQLIFYDISLFSSNDIDVTLILYRLF